MAIAFVTRLSRRAVRGEFGGQAHLLAFNDSTLEKFDRLSAVEQPRVWAAGERPRRLGHGADGTPDGRRTVPGRRPDARRRFLG